MLIACCNVSSHIFHVSSIIHIFYTIARLQYKSSIRTARVTVDYLVSCKYLHQYPFVDGRSINSLCWSIVMSIKIQI